MNDDSSALLILITGSPGSGKTTLARTLANELDLPVLSRDGLKEILLDRLGAADRAESRRIGGASFALFNAVLAIFAGRTTLIAENSMTRGQSEEELRLFITRTPTILLHCEAKPATIERRIRARSNDVTRHPGHFDADALPEAMQRLGDGLFAPLALGCRLLRIATDDGYRPSLPDILAFVRQHQIAEITPS